MFIWYTISMLKAKGKNLEKIRKWWRIANNAIVEKMVRNRAIIMTLVFSVVVFIFFFGVLILSFDTVRYVFVVLWRNILDCEFITKHAYFLLSLLLSISIAYVVDIFDYRRLMPEIKDRDKKYILEMFTDRGDESPVPTRRKLIENILSERPREKNREEYEIIRQYINQNIDHIKLFLRQEHDSRVLCLNGKWGSGKTTSLLIAINEYNTSKNKYIYEAAFKYSGNVDEYLKDILNTLGDVLLSFGITTNSFLDSMVSNFDSSFRKTLGNTFKNWRDFNTLTTELTMKLNVKYRESGCKKKVFIIVDDLDRLQGKDIIRVLSLLSMLRNLTFVRIIVIADLNVIYEALDKCDVVDPSKFVEKYLPSSRSLLIQSGYEMVNTLLGEKILYAQKDGSGLENVHPIIAAVFIGLLAEEMIEQTRLMAHYRYRWLRKANQELPPAPITESLSQLLQAPGIMLKGRDDYAWADWNNNLRKFQNIVYALEFEVSPGKGMIRINKMFDEGAYELVYSWIFPYMEKRWGIFGFTVRDAFNMLGSIEYSNLPTDPVEQFVYAFNQLFPNESLEVLKEGDDITRVA